MAQLIHEPIDITVEPRIRAIMRRRKKEQLPPEVADIQIVINALSAKIQWQAERIKDLEWKIKRQKTQLAEYEKQETRNEQNT